MNKNEPSAKLIQAAINIIDASSVESGAESNLSNGVEIDAHLTIRIESNYVDTTLEIIHEGEIVFRVTGPEPSDMATEIYMPSLDWEIAVLKFDSNKP